MWQDSTASRSSTGRADGVRSKFLEFRCTLRLISASTLTHATVVKYDTALPCLGLQRVVFGSVGKTREVSMRHYSFASVLLLALFSAVVSLLAQPVKRAPRAEAPRLGVEKEIALERAPRVEKEIARLQQARARGAQYYAITFSPYSLFWKSENEDQLDAVEAENDRQIGEAALNEGLTLMESCLPGFFLRLPIPRWCQECPRRGILGLQRHAEVACLSAAALNTVACLQSATGCTPRWSQSIRPCGTGSWATNEALPSLTVPGDLSRSMS